MSKRYCADSAVQTAIAQVLGFYGLEPNPAAASRKPAVASTIGEQFQRLVVAENVVAEVRRRVPIGGDDRRLIFRLVDSARQGVEEADRLALGSKYAGTRDSCVIAFAIRCDLSSSLLICRPSWSGAAVPSPSGETLLA